MVRTFLLVEGIESGADRVAKLLVLADAGCEVLRAGSGPAALSLLEELHVAPALVFADFSMQDMNLIEFLGAMRMRRWLDGVPVAVLAGSIADRELVNCYRLGVCAVLTEPFARHEIRSVIADWARPAHRAADAATREGPGPAARSHVA